MSTKPKWLIAGGMGFIGRNLVKYLLDNNLASEIRVADKRAKFMAFLSADHKAALDHEAVEAVQVDVSDEESVDKIFEESRGGGAWDFVVNCAAEMDLTRPEAFHAKASEGARLLARAASAAHVKRFVQVSTAQVYASTAKASAEGGKLAPWTLAAEYALKAEEAVRSTPGLAWVVLRPAIVYGPGDTTGLMPRAVIACTYKRMKDEKLEFLWGAELKMNTVHVFDVARAIFFAAKKAEAGSIFNLVDKSDTDQGALSRMLGAIFGIEVGFYGSIMSNLAATKLDSIVNDANASHLAPWMAQIKEAGIKQTPLSPFLHKQLLQNNHLAIDGAAIEAAGFKLAVAELTDEGLRDTIAQAITQGIFPPVLAGVAGPAAAGAGKA